MRAFLGRHGQLIVNLVVSGLIGYGAAWRAYHAWFDEKFDIVEALAYNRSPASPAPSPPVSGPQREVGRLRRSRTVMIEALFFTSNLVLVTVILVRRQHLSVDRGVFRQAVALAAFFSALAFDTRPEAPYDWMPAAAGVVAAVGIVLGMAVLLNLGRSFGIMIAARKVVTGGAYRIVRHPMYVTDTIMRTSFVLVNPSAYNLLLYVGATACYVYRAVLEERFLSRLPEYREYMEKVRYRFIPGIF